MLTKGMATDWARYGLQVNALGPGYFRTELNAAVAADPVFNAWLEKRTPTGRWATVDELIGAAIFLASDASSFVNGHILYVDGRHHLFALKQGSRVLKAPAEPPREVPEPPREVPEPVANGVRTACGRLYGVAEPYGLGGGEMREAVQLGGAPCGPAP